MLMAVSLFPLVIKKNLEELKIASIVLFVGVAGFVLIILGQLLIEGNYENKDQNYDSYYELDNDLNFVKGLSMLTVAFGF